MKRLMIFFLARLLVLPVYAQFEAFSLTKDIEITIDSSTYSNVENEVYKFLNRSDAKDYKSLTIIGDFEIVPNFVCEMNWIENLELNSGRDRIRLTEELSKLISLRTLICYDSILCIDSELVFPNLTGLYLFGSCLREFPVAICDWPMLELIDMQGGLFETLPIEIGHLKELRSLNLSNCNLNSLPEEICKLSNLKYLSLGHNELESLPICLCDISLLVEIHLYGNDELIIDPILQRCLNGKSIAE